MVVGGAEAATVIGARASNEGY